MKVNYVPVVFSFVTYCVLYVNCNSNFRVTEEIGFKKEFYESKPDYDTKYSKGNQKKDYVDPLDMLNYVHSTKSMVQNDDKNKPGTSVVKGCENCSAYMQRFVNLFLISVGLKDYVIKRDKYVTLNLLIKKEDLDILHLFSEYGNTDLKVVNKALTDIFTSDLKLDEFMKKQNDDHEYHNDIFNNFFKPTLIVIGRLPLDYPQHCIAVCVLFVFGATLWLMINTRSYRLALFSLLFIIFSVGFGWNWFKLYKIADAKRFSSRLLNDNAIPIYCRPETMTWYQYVYYYYTYEKQCEEYFKREMVDPIVEVSPTVVLVETFATIILHPADKLGSAIGNFVSAVIDAVPWPYKVFVVPGILLFVAIFVIIICVVLVGGKLTFRIPFSSFEIGSATPRFIQVPNQQREFIENVPSPSSPNESIGDKRTKRKNKSMTPKAKKEVSDLLNRLRNQKMIEDGSGDSETSNSKQSLTSENSKSISSDKSPEKSEVHVHLHLPKSSADYSNIGKNDNLKLTAINDNVIIKQDGITQTDLKIHDKTKEKSDESSENS